MQYSGGPHLYGDDHSAEVCSKRGSGEDERDDRELIEEKVFLVSQGILEGERCLVTRLLRFNGENRGKRNP